MAGLSFLSAISPSAEVVNAAGLVTLAALTFTLARFFWEIIRVYFVNGKGIDLKTLGEWAVVTGATDGIGKEYALQLARTYGINIVLISRSAEKLKTVADQIEKESRVKTKCVAVDFSGGKEIYDIIKNELEGLDIGILVNNVGTGTPTLDLLHTHDLEALAAVVRVNCSSPVLMTRLVLPCMMAKRKGAIVNLSSIAAYSKAPLISAYAASKAFIDRFSQLSHLEYNLMEDTGIFIQTLRCAFVSTKLGRWPRFGPIVPDAASYVRSALKTIGVAEITTGWLTHELISPFMAFYMPDWFAKPFMRNFQRIYREYKG